MLFDVIVIGVGGMGSSAVYQLAGRGARVLGLEQFDIAHDRGSSHGVNRIIRLGYAEDPRYVPLLRRAYELWRELEHESGESLLFITGGLDVGHEGSAFIEGSLRSCRLHDLPHELLDAATVHARYPGCQFPSDLVSVYQPASGFVMAERTVTLHAELARRRGAEIHTQEAVVGWSRNGDGVVVETDRGRYRARRLVITAGAWTSRLVPALAGRAVPERQVLIWTEPRRPELFTLGVFPIFYMEPEAGRFYGFPIHGVPGFKIGKYNHLKQKVQPDTVDRECHPEDEAILREGIRRYFPEADGPTLAMKTCMFTNTADEHFVIDYLPDHPEVAIAGGFSGHGYKFCSIVGEVMADLALDGGTRWNLELFKLNRLM
jgi:sarcosine oxidase